MKNPLTIACAALLLTAACVTTTINTSSILETTQAVVLRHDAYAGGFEPYLAESAALMVLVTTNEKVEKQTLAVPLLPVTARHDQYVEADLTLSDLERRVYLRSSAELKHLVE